jgi:hypothetical protein
MEVEEYIRLNSNMISYNGDQASLVAEETKEPIGNILWKAPLGGMDAIPRESIATIHPNLPKYLDRKFRRYDILQKFGQAQRSTRSIASAITSGSERTKSALRPTHRLV